VLRNWLWLAVLLLVAGAATAGAIWWRPARSATARSLGPTAEVTRGEMVVTMNVGGELRADSRTVISNELRWPVVIQEVVAEGTLVKEGDTIVQFECRELTDAITQQELNLTSAENTHTQAYENLQLRRKELDNKVRKAEQAVVDADEDQRRYVEGDWPVEKNEADAAIQIAQRDLALAKATLEFKLKVNEDKELNSPYSANEIEAEKLGVQRLELSLERAQSSKMILLKYANPRQIRKLKMGVEDAKLDLERTRLEAKTQLRVAEAAEAAAEAKLEMQKERLTEYQEDEGKLLVKAERTGLVVYDTGGSRWQPSQVTIEVGARVNSRQQLMIIPDMDSLLVRVRVYESMIDQVKVGQKAFIHLEVRGDVTLTGTVARVAVLPDSQDHWSRSAVKVYKVHIEFDEPVSTLNLKPGMTAKVELEVARLDNVLTVPVAAVHSRGKQAYCWRVEGGEARAVPVLVGRMNERRVEIRGGLSADDVILLVPPDAGEEADQEEGKEDGEGTPPGGKTGMKAPKGGRPSGGKPSGGGRGRR